MPSPRRRDGFTEPERTQLALRAGYQCSKPDCRVLTVGPEAKSDKSVSVGRAAHVTAASPRGPRYDADLPSVERKSALRNGIWLCAGCADVIDAHGGRDYSAEDLRRWRREHEEWIAARLNRPVPEPLTEIGGTHRARGIGEVTGLAVEARGVRIMPGTLVEAEGIGTVIGTRIGGKGV